MLAFTLVSIYLYVLINVVGWNLRQQVDTAFTTKQLLMPRKEQLGVILPLLVMAVFLHMVPFGHHVIWASLVLAAVLGYLPNRHSALDTWPFMALAFSLYAYTLFPVPTTFEDNLFPFTGGYLFVQAAALIALAYSYWMSKRYPPRLSYLLLLVLAPLSLFGLSYVLSDNAAGPFLYPVWTLELLASSALGSYQAAKASRDIDRMVYTVLANVCVTLCPHYVAKCQYLNLGHRRANCQYELLESQVVSTAT